MKFIPYPQPHFSASSADSGKPTRKVFFFHKEKFLNRKFSFTSWRIVTFFRGKLWKLFVFICLILVLPFSVVVLFENFLCLSYCQWREICGLSWRKRQCKRRRKNSRSPLCIHSFSHFRKKSFSRVNWKNMDDLFWYE